MDKFWLRIQSEYEKLHLATLHSIQDHACNEPHENSLLH